MISFLGGLFGRLVEWLLERADEVPTTNVRILVTIVAFILVVSIWLTLAVVHSFFATVALWEPSAAMLTFISVWAGLDVMQFGVKRGTHKPEGDGAAATDPPPSPAPPA